MLLIIIPILLNTLVGMFFLNIILLKLDPQYLKEKNSLFKLFFIALFSLQIGTALTSWLYYLGINLGLKKDYRLLPEIFFIISALLVNINYSKKILELYSPLTTSHAKSSFNFYAFLLLTCTLIIFICFEYGLLKEALLSPFGAWDSWAIWRLRARTLFLFEENFQNLFSKPIPWSHLDYPLLMPLSLTRAWTIIGRESLANAALMLNIYSVLPAALMSFFIWERSKLASFFCCIFIFLNKNFIGQVNIQNADLFLAGYFLSSAIFLTKWSKTKNLLELLLAIFFALSAAWTKNEGLVFLYLSIFIIITNTKLKLFSTAKEVFFKNIYASFSLILATASLLHFKIFITQSNDLILKSSNTLEKLLDLNRYRLIFSYFKILITSNFTLPVLAFLILFLCSYHKTKNQEKISKELSQIPLVIFACMASVYFLVYVTTYLDLMWHLNTSCNRVLMQITPLGITALFYLIPSKIK